MDWLRKAATKSVSGINWLGKNVLKPASGLLKQLPVVGEVVTAAEPAVEVLSKGLQFAEDALKGVPKGQRRALPTMSDVKRGIESVQETGRKAIDAYTTLKSKGLSFKRPRMEL